MIKNKTVTAIILTAGNSTRFGTGKNKNFEEINGKKVLSYSLAQFDKNNYVDNIIIAIREEDRKQVEDVLQKENLSKTYKFVLGGKSRQESVLNCIKNTESDIVIIHDGARPAIKQSYINECIENMEKYKGVTIGVPSKDTIKITNDEGIVISTTVRKNTWIIQTPQCFNRKLLLELHQQYIEKEATDDCMIMEDAGYDVKMIKGDYTNLKITTYEDIDIMRSLLREI